MFQSQFPAGLVYKENFYFVLNGNLYKINKGTSGTSWINKTQIGHPASVALRVHDNLNRLKEGIYTVASDNNLWEYNITSQNWINHNQPSSDINCLSAAGAKMYEHMLFVVGSDKKLHKFTAAGSSWSTIGKPSNSFKFNAYSLATSLKDGTLFILGYKTNIFGLKTRLYELTIDGNSSSWTSHGRPSKSGISLGASMTGNKIFLGSKNGKVFERYWNGSTWSWVDHGHAISGLTGGSVLSHPAKISDGKFFITAFAMNGELHERWWNGNANSWGWNNSHGVPLIYPSQGAPIKCGIISGPTSANDNPDRVFVIAKKNYSDEFYIFSRYWSGATWDYFNHGEV